MSFLILILKKKKDNRPTAFSDFAEKSESKIEEEKHILLYAQKVCPFRPQWVQYSNKIERIIVFSVYSNYLKQNFLYVCMYVYCMYFLNSSGVYTDISIIPHHPSLPTPTFYFFFHGV